MAYTGVADIDGDTALWLARLLTKAPDIEAGLDSIGAATEAYFKQKGLRIPHAVIATGWASRQGKPPEGMPFIAASSNTYGKSLHEFKTRVNFVKPGAAYLGYDFGQRLTADEKRKLDVAVRSGLKSAREVSTGTLSASLVHPREVFGPALRIMGVASVVLLHNHPSGDPTPSREDLRLTRQLVDASKLLDLQIHDHVIIGNGTDAYVYMASRSELQ